MKNLNLKQIIMSKITLFMLFLLLLSSHSFAQCNVHSNFREIVENLQKGQTYDVQVTIVNPGRDGGKSHRWTAWGPGFTNCPLSKKNICEIGLNINYVPLYFSGAHFDKNKKQVQSFKFDVVNNSLEVTLNSWGNNKFTESKVIKRGRLIYVLYNDGRMAIFNFKKQQCIRLE